MLVFLPGFTLMKRLVVLSQVTPDHLVLKMHHSL